MEKDIYKIGKQLGLEKKDIDSVTSTSSKQPADTVNTPSADLYKNGAWYGTISPKNLYKSGDKYGTISPKDIYKAGTAYGTISPRYFQY